MWADNYRTENSNYSTREKRSVRSNDSSSCKLIRKELHRHAVKNLINFAHFCM